MRASIRQKGERPVSERPHDLPPGVPAGGPDIGDDPRAAEERGLQMLAETGERIVAGVERAAPAWAVGQVARILDQWGTHEAGDRARVLAEAQEAGAVAARRVGRELSSLLGQDPEAQAATPLQVVRALYREPTELLRRAGVPPVERDAFAERAWPDDDYGMVPDTMADLGDEDLAALHLAWGVAKATVVKARRAGEAPGAG
jgi:hypothetical protein